MCVERVSKFPYSPKSVILFNRLSLATFLHGMCVGWVEGSQGWRRISWVLQGSAGVLGIYSSPRWIRDGGRKEKAPSPRSLTCQNWVVLLENDCLEGKPGPLEKQHAPGYKDRQSRVSWWYIGNTGLWTRTPGPILSFCFLGYLPKIPGFVISTVRDWGYIKG